MSKETEGATQEGAAEEESQEESGVTFEGEFDPEKAKATIEKQRASEAAAKQKAKELEAELAKYRAADEEKAEAEKALEVKIAERDARIEALEKEVASTHVKNDFLAKAAGKGIDDPELAYVAAKEQGYLGEYDPKEGKVGDHDFEALGERYPSFKGSGVAQTGDAGTRTKGKAQTVGEQFNRSIRGSLHGSA